MLMPTTVASPLPTVMSPVQASTMVTSSATTMPSITTSIQNLQQKDTTWTKLFVGGLPYHTTDKSLREHFEVYGDIEEAVVITDRSTGKSRGYGFVIMATKEAADRALKEPNPIIDGRKANVNLAILGAKPRGNLTAQLPLTALRPGFPALLGQYGADMSSLGGQLGCLTPPFAIPAGHGQPAVQAAAVQPPAASVSPGALAGAAPGKARSSMNLSMISGRQAVAPQTQTSPYIQQLYAASANPYGQVSPNIMQLMQSSTGNPLLDMYTNQYAAMGSMGYHHPSTAAAVTQPAVLPASQSLAIDAGQANAAVAGGYLGFYSPFAAQQLTAAGLTAAAAAGLPGYAAAAPPTAASPVAQQGQAGETRTQ